MKPGITVIVLLVILFVAGAAHLTNTACVAACHTDSECEACSN